MHRGGDFIFAHASVAQLSEMLQADFMVYKHEKYVACILSFPFGLLLVSAQ